MSTISANDLQNTSGGIPTVKGQRLIPTACVNFDGTGTVSIRDSENVSSVTDGGVGIFTANFTSTMADADYTVNVSSSRLTNSDISGRPFGTRTTAAVGIEVSILGVFNSYRDVEFNAILVMGGQ
jgi:hypothetical protein